MASLTRPSILLRIRKGEIGAEKISQWYFCVRADVERLARERLNVPTFNA
jgi:hypothetical protein